MENIKVLHWEIKQLEEEEKLLSDELKLLRKSENDPNDLTCCEISRQIKPIAYLNESPRKMCRNCIRTNKEYPELFDHEYRCICIVELDINREKSFPQECNCICNDS